MDNEKIQIPRAPRIRYPASKRKSIIVDLEEFVLCDISISGAKMIRGVESKIFVGDQVNIKIRFEKYEHQSQAIVVRTVGDLIMIQFDKKIPTKIIKQESKRLNLK